MAFRMENSMLKCVSLGACPDWKKRADRKGEMGVPVKL